MRAEWGQMNVNRVRQTFSARPMNSIRSYLAVRLLIGFILLLSLASILIYFISKRILETDFDNRLFAKAQAVMASTSQKGDKLDIDWTNLPQEIGSHGKGPGLIQILDSSGRTLEGNAFLNTGPFVLSDRETYENATLTQGEKVRVLALPFLPSVEEEDIAVTPPSIRQKCLLIVANDRDQLDHSLNLMAGVLVAMTILISALSLGIVAQVLRRGLRPLTGLSLEMAEIDEKSLGRTINVTSLPNELRPIAEKLNDLLGRLEVSFGRERRFSADVSHELRTPVAELRSLSEIMLRQRDHPVNTKQAFQDVLDASLQMEALVSTLLTMVREENNIAILKLEKIDLSELIRKSWKAYERQALAKDLKLVLDLPEHALIETDPSLLRLVLNNVLSNAVEYTPPAGKVHIYLQPSKNCALLRIENDTTDVSAEDVSHFLERFWRKDKVRSNTEHMGIGLSLTQIICQSLQIDLSVLMPKPDLVCVWLGIPTKPGKP